MPTPHTDPFDVSDVSKGKAAEMGQRVADKIDEKRGAAASGLESAGGARVVNAADASPDAVGVAADYVRETDVKAMMTDVQRLVKNNPGVALLTAAALGFLIARTFSRD